jgi:hypothetical protein
MSAFEKNGMTIEPYLHFRQDTYGGRELEVFVLGEGESIPTLANKHSFHGPSVVLRHHRSGCVESTEYYVDDPGAWRTVNAWVAMVGRGEAALFQEFVPIDTEMLKDWRNARVADLNQRLKDEELCDWCGEDHHLKEREEK